MEALHLVEPIAMSVPPIEAENAPPQPSTPSPNWHVVRPLLDVSRQALRHYVTTLKIPYVDDPSNDNRDFARVRMRQFLAEEGADNARLIATQKAMARAQKALAQRAFDAAGALLKTPPAAGILRFDRDLFAQIEEETQLRIMAAALQSATGATYRPRLETLQRSLSEAQSGKTATLHGALILPRKGDLFVGREYNAVKDTVTETGPDSLWDSRFVIYGPEIKELHVRALGPDGVRTIKAEGEVGIPYDLLLALPGVFEDDTLVGCADLHFGARYIQELPASGKAFPHSLLAH